MQSEVYSAKTARQVTAALADVTEIPQELTTEAKTVAAETGYYWCRKDASMLGYHDACVFNFR